MIHGIKFNLDKLRHFRREVMASHATVMGMLDRCVADQERTLLWAQDRQKNFDCVRCIEQNHIMHGIPAWIYWQLPESTRDAFEQELSHVPDKSDRYTYLDQAEYIPPKPDNLPEDKPVEFPVL